MSEAVLVCGISGQDGGYLASHLLSLGYEVWGTSRNVEERTFENLSKLGVIDSVRLLSLDLRKAGAIESVLSQVRPDQIYNLSGQTSVGVSFQKPLETIESITCSTVNLLEGVRLSGRDVRVYCAGSVETFGDTGGSAANEATPLNPCSPYAIAKAAAFWTVSTYRKAYKMFVCTGIMSNHESPLRPIHFVTRKIINAVAELSIGRGAQLHLGNLEIERDWGWSPEYMEASVRMLQQETPEDYILATGETCSLRAFVETAFAVSGFDWRDHVVLDGELKRPTDIAAIRLNPARAAIKLGWRATYRMEEVVKMMLAAEIESLKSRA
jgi:GDPmannose 4,6-dehydratase